MPANSKLLEFTDDAVLNGRLLLRQPRKGHRIGHDAILLAAAVAASAGQNAIDLGAGVGAAGLALAARVPDLSVTLVEIDPELAALAAHNIARNDFGDRMRAVALDAGASARAFAAAGVLASRANHVLMNPPFNDPARQNTSPDQHRRRAHAAPPGLLSRWISTASRLLQPSGAVTLIWRADGLDLVIAALKPKFGGLAILPVHGMPDQKAIRVLVRATKGSNAPLSLLPGLILNDKKGQPTGEAEEVLRNAKPLALAGS